LIIPLSVKLSSGIYQLYLAIQAGTGVTISEQL
jgi:hypothetical protein